MSPRSYRGRHRLEIPARPRTVRRALAAIGLGAILTAGIITAAAPAAHAVPAAMADIICETLDAHPTRAGVSGTATGLVDLLGVTYKRAHEIITEAVDQACPHRATLLPTEVPA